MNTRKYTLTYIAADGTRSSIFLHWGEVVARTAEFIRAGHEVETLRNSRRVCSVHAGGSELYVTSNHAAPGSMAGVTGNDTTEALEQSIAIVH